ncbi:MAG: tRNA pseudouridine(55) synthase TruB [Thermodesulfovibrio sp.]|nr:tRNA pseudouridine(55) synthase TruB [Thermodesulfovibrio sp.]
MDLIINLHKPSGITSQQAVTRVKKMLKVRKAGHTGTLDPLATGVMLVCLGEATKVSRFFLDMDKKYRATVKLGERTDTGDAEGRVIETTDFSLVTEPGLMDAAMSFTGAIEQTPPMYSAVKVDGKALYKLARKGIEIERKSRLVMIYDIGVSGVSLPFFDLFVACSKGTYIRTLCEDIGRKLGTGAHLTALQRLSVGRFDIEDALTFEDLATRDLLPDGRSVFNIDAALSEMPEIILDEEEAGRVRHGQRIPMKYHDPVDGTRALKLKGPDRDLIGIGSLNAGMIVVERNLNLQLESVKT